MAQNFQIPRLNKQNRATRKKHITYGEAIPQRYPPKFKSSNLSETDHTYALSPHTPGVIHRVITQVDQITESLYKVIS